MDITCTLPGSDQQKQNPMHKAQGFGERNWLKLDFNCFAFDVAYGDPTKIIEKRLLHRHRRLSRLPLFGSFFRNDYSARAQEKYSKYNKYDTYWQGEIFKEITGKAYAKDISTKCAKNFSNEFPSFFVKKMMHKKHSFVKSVDRSDLGAVAVDRTVFGLNDRAPGEGALVDKNITNSLLNVNGRSL